MIHKNGFSNKALVTKIGIRLNLVYWLVGREDSTATGSVSGKLDHACAFQEDPPSLVQTRTRGRFTAPCQAIGKTIWL